jgi:PhzF family phenazine biosynthesis protein
MSDRVTAMRSRIYRVDAFTRRRFAGNPAAVVILDAFPGDALLQAVARENNLSETAFVVPHGEDYRLRWFTPAVEVPLCGHATLASAAVVLERVAPERQNVTFHTLSGALHVTRAAGGYALNFPARPSTRIETPASLCEALGVAPVEVHANEFNYLVLLADESELRRLQPDMNALLRLATPQRHGVIATAAGHDGYDFVSRYFAPKIGVPEDPVTGAAHCTLTPFWAARTATTSFRAYQASRRGGEMLCRLQGARVELEGACVFYMEGEVAL